MKGDFSRNTFDPGKHFSRVLMQQGRVQLDADWNEQVSILLHYLQTLATDLIGQRGGPSANWGFEIQPVESGSRLDDLSIGNGRYYVDGVLCENQSKVDDDGNQIPVTYYRQPFYFPDLLPDPPFLVYLDVWERHVTYLEDEEIREVALGGPDTATRAQVVWQVKVWELTPQRIAALQGNYIAVNCDGLNTNWEQVINMWWQSEDRGRLQARADIQDTPEEPCITTPDARYRGAENQLYRVEIHQGGSANDATFKWSRDNGSVVFPIGKLVTDSTAGTTTVTVDRFGRDSRFDLAVGDWVEIVDDDYVLHYLDLDRQAEALLKVSSIDRINMQVTLEGAPVSDVGQDPDKHPLLRRWDQKETEEITLTDNGTIALQDQEDTWLDLEDGVQIYFEDNGATYRPGDYWFIPARTATGQVEWPKDLAGKLLFTAPHGVQHHYAPLAIIENVGASPDDCRCSFEPLCPPTYGYGFGNLGIGSDQI